MWSIDVEGTDAGLQDAGLQGAGLQDAGLQSDGLHADNERAAEAFAVDIHRVVAARTRRARGAAASIEPLAPTPLDAQMQALCGRAPPRVIRIAGRVGFAQLREIARFAAPLRPAGAAAWVLDGPVHAPSPPGGTATDILRSLREELPSLAPVVACTLAEAQRWLGEKSTDDIATAPSAARRLREAGARAVCIVGIDGDEGRSLDWLDSEHARGWLASAQRDDIVHRKEVQGWPASTPVGKHGDAHRHRFATCLAAALARGFVVADAAVLAKMATTTRSFPTGSAAGHSLPLFVHDPALLPQLSWGEQARFAEVPGVFPGRLDLYAIVDSAARVLQVLAAGIRTVQLRIKTPTSANSGWHDTLRSEIQRSVAACRAADAQLFINDHWQLACELGAGGVHLGQEDLLELGDAGRAALQASPLALGISSHSLWEMCRACTLQPRYIACGPVWPTLTKAMPWRAQGLDNLSWWCRMSPASVVAIGGVLEAEQVHEAARCGADGVCIVRGLGERPESIVPALRAALSAGRASAAVARIAPTWPHPSLPAEPER